MLVMAVFCILISPGSRINQISVMKPKIDRWYCLTLACLFLFSSCKSTDLSNPILNNATTPWTQIPTDSQNLLPRGNIILLGSYEEMGYGIFILGLDGSYASGIQTSLAEITRGASWSSNQRGILFDSGGNIYLADSTTGGIDLIIDTSTLDTNPVWVPNGDRFAFERDAGGSIWLGEIDGHMQPLLPAGQNKTFVLGNWNPDGSEFVYTEMTLGPSQESVPTAPDNRLMVFDTEADKSRPLITEDISLEMNKPTYPRFSPNGNTVAFQAISSGHVRIFLTGSDGQNVRELTTEPGNYSNPVWSPDGQFILAFTGMDQENYYSIFNTGGIFVSSIHGLDGIITDWITSTQR